MAPQFYPRPSFERRASPFSQAPVAALLLRFTNASCSLLAYSSAQISVCPRSKNLAIVSAIHFFRFVLSFPNSLYGIWFWLYQFYNFMSSCESYSRLYTCANCSASYKRWLCAVRSHCKVYVLFFFLPALNILLHVSAD
jgi:hypothetical protein